LRLPLELRNKVYVYASDTLSIDLASHIYGKIGRLEWSLLAACRQMNAEAATYKRSFTRLVISESGYWDEVQKFPMSQRRAITSVTFSGFITSYDLRYALHPGDDLVKCGTLLRLCPSLRTVYLNCEICEEVFQDRSSGIDPHDSVREIQSQVRTVDLQFYVTQRCLKRSVRTSETLSMQTLTSNQRDAREYFDHMEKVKHAR